MNDYTSEKLPCLIFSLPSPQWEERLINLNIPFIRMQSCYKGKLKVSYLVEDRVDNFDRVLELCRESKENSVIFLNQERYAKKYFLNPNTFKLLGKFTPVSPSKAMSKEDWFRKGNQFYVIVSA